ncbi:Protein kinase C and casein kinase substrate in neurons protein 2 [Thelohanellus kitauei]|uniref:Protein kinase C and casein kinase substrate in neurons protein 2 n=1 Tax=Thelohanellus kitauei TaxID=669202 RepID=A0A0C2JRV9_THEKT|nr:Protein kinase C and casein kinase substrate in neurons protein 2 [Thelohanellus kitauei]
MDDRGNFRTIQHSISLFANIKLDPRNITTNQMASEDIPSFWEAGGFKVCLKRLDHSPELFNDLNGMFHEIIEQEAKTEKFYGDISQKYRKIFLEDKNSCENKILVYNTGKKALFAILDFLDHISIQHRESKTKILSLCSVPLNNLLNERFQPIQLPKEIKSIKQDFQAAQEPYVTNFNQFDKARRAYVQYCRTFEPDFGPQSLSCLNLGPDNIFDNLDPKKNKKRLKLLKRFEVWNTQLYNLLESYIFDMKNSYQKCEEHEDIRLKTFKTALLNLSSIIQFNTPPNAAELVEDIRKNIELFDPEDDQAWWTKIYGPDSSFDFYQSDKPPSSGTNSDSEQLVDHGDDVSDITTES